MSAICVLTPMLIGSWPMIVSAISGAASSLGFAVASSSGQTQLRETETNRVETELANSEIMGERAGEAQTMLIEKDGVTLEFRRDERGACSVCVSGPLSKDELRRIGEEVSARVVQQFAYHKLVTELKKRNFTIVDEHVQQDDSIHVRVRLNG